MSLDKEIEALESTLARLKELKEHQVGAVKEVDKWQPKGGDFYVGTGGSVSMIDSRVFTKEFGMERETREQAERAAIEMRRFNRLLALRDELYVGKSVNWLNHKEEKYSLYYSHEVGRWELDWNVTNESIMPYFTTLESAEKACDMLNSGEVEL